jgi:hypothetical protein
MRDETKPHDGGEEGIAIRWRYMKTDSKLWKENLQESGIKGKKSQKGKTE